MKKLTYVILCLTTLMATPAFSQEKTQPAETASATLTKFDLDFPGGTPNELVAAIQKAMGRPLNVIVPNEYASVKLPPLKMKNVNVPQLFKALELSSQTRQVIPGVNDYSNNQIMFGFKTEGRSSEISDDSVWYFLIAGQQTQPPKMPRFYLLTPYLDRGLTVDDITTAIQTGWKLAGISSTPTLSFHKETKLLIAFGDWSQLQTIDEVLKALNPPAPAPAPTSATKAKPEPEKTKP